MTFSYRDAASGTYYQANEVVVVNMKSDSSDSPPSSDVLELIFDARRESLDKPVSHFRPSIVSYALFALSVAGLCTMTFIITTSVLFVQEPPPPRPTPDYLAERELAFANYMNDRHNDMTLNKVISCYYNTPSENGTNDLMPLDINPKLCTHINIAFAQVVNKEIVLNENQERTIKEIIKLRLKNKDLKILLSVGGAGGHNGFSEMVVDHASRKTFIRSIKAILRNYTLDGIDLDWEFPAIHAARPNTTSNVTVNAAWASMVMQNLGTPQVYEHGRERQHFSQLLREIRNEFFREKKNYLLTVAVGAPKIIVDTAYDVEQLNMYVDYINLMTYDFHSYTKLTPFTGLNSPLYPRSTEQLYLSTLNINFTVNMYVSKGMYPCKIVVGIPTYGHSFHLVNPTNTDIGSPASGFGTLGSLGFVDYSEICKFINDHTGDVTVKKDNETKVPYLYHSHDWVSYDDPISVMEKAKYILDNRLLGAMIYSLNADDYRGDCQVLGVDKKFPLLQSIRDTFNK